MQGENDLQSRNFPMLPSTGTQAPVLFLSCL